MGEYVGRVEWEAVEVTTGEKGSGTLSVRLEDVLIIQRKVLKANLMMRERLAAFDDLPSQEQIKLISKEIQRDPASREVGDIWYSKYLQLSPALYVGYAEHCADDTRVGIGLTGGTGSIAKRSEGCDLTSSWDWFTLTGKGVAVKDQQGGRIRVRQAATPCGCEIVHMVFDSDVPMQVSKGIQGPTDEPDWRIKVRKGSEICWPSLVDGKPAPNGYVARYK